MMSNSKTLITGLTTLLPSGKASDEDLICHQQCSDKLIELGWYPPEQVMQLERENAELANRLSESFGDGYFDGFIDGAKYQEQHDLNTKFAMAALSDAAMIYSEDAENKKSEQVGLSVKRQCLNQIKAEAGRAGFVAGWLAGMNPHSLGVNTESVNYAVSIAKGE